MSTSIQNYFKVEGDMENAIIIKQCHLSPLYMLHAEHFVRNEWTAIKLIKITIEFHSVYIFGRIYFY